METIVTIALATFGIYLLAGLIFGIVFSLFGGVRKIDPAAEEGTLGFRLLIIPGCMIFWPFLWKRLAGKTPPPEECTRHRRSSHP